MRRHVLLTFYVSLIVSGLSLEQLYWEDTVSGSAVTSKVISKNVLCSHIV